MIPPPRSRALANHHSGRRFIAIGQDSRQPVLSFRPGLGSVSRDRTRRHNQAVRRLNRSYQPQVPPHSLIVVAVAVRSLLANPYIISVRRQRGFYDFGQRVPRAHLARGGDHWPLGCRSEAHTTVNPMLIPVRCLRGGHWAASGCWWIACGNSRRPSLCIRPGPWRDRCCGSCRRGFHRAGAAVAAPARPHR